LEKQTVTSNAFSKSTNILIHQTSSHDLRRFYDNWTCVGEETSWTVSGKTRRLLPFKYTSSYAEANKPFLAGNISTLEEYWEYL